MRLYKNVKIKIKGNLTCAISKKETFTDRNKCYEELDLFKKRLSYPLMGTFQRCCESEDVKLEARCKSNMGIRVRGEI